MLVLLSQLNFSPVKFSALIRNSIKLPSVKKIVPKSSIKCNEVAFHSWNMMHDFRRVGNSKGHSRQQFAPLLSPEREGGVWCVSKFPLGLSWQVWPGRRVGSADAGRAPHQQKTDISQMCFAVLPNGRAVRPRAINCGGNCGRRKNTQRVTRYTGAYTCHVAKWFDNKRSGQLALCMLRSAVMKNDERSASVRTHTLGAFAGAPAKTIHLCHAPQLHNQFSIRLQTRKNRARARTRRLY